MRFLILFFSILCLTPLSFAETVFLRKLRGKGISPQQIEVAEELVRSTIEELDYELVPRKSAAEILLTGRIIQLGESIIFSMSKYENGKKTNSTKLKAVNFDDIDRVIARVVRGVLSNQSAKKNIQMDNVTREDMQNTNRRIQAVSQWRFGIGPVFFNHLNDDKTAFGFFFGRHFGINPDFAVNLNLDLAYGQSGSNASIISGQVGVDYFLTRSSTSLYLTGNTGYSSTASNDREQNGSSLNILGETKSGFSMSAGVGVKLFRVSTVNLAFQADYNYLFAENSHGHPNWFTLKILLFRGE